MSIPNTDDFDRSPDSEPQNLHTEPRWYQSVRTRFGLLLALALLPWLLLTGLEALSTLDRDRASQTQLADIVAANAVREIGRTLESGRLGLDAAPLLLAEAGCEAGSRDILDRLDAYEALIVKDADGQPICQRPPLIEDLRIEAPKPFEADTAFRIERGMITRGGETRPVVVLQSFIRSSQTTYTLVLSSDFGQRDFVSSALGPDARMALTRRDGKGIIGRDAADGEPAAFQDIIGADTEVLMDQPDAVTGQPRRIASRYFDELGVYVTVGRNADSGAMSGLFNPYTSVLLPILAWIIGFGMIWAGTQTMLLTPIAKVRGTARQFARGRMDTRVDLSGSAAAEVHGLATSFNTMAEQLEERASRIADNIDEKDTLMREIHHRVKNNLQIIISLLNMQERKAQTEEAIDAIAETRTRINAIAIVHRGLYESPDLRRIEVDPFVSRLLGSIGDSLGLGEAGISLTHDANSRHLTADNAIPVALFIVEAISNAAHHGVERGGKIHVEISQPDATSLKIEVCDDGRGVGDPGSMRGIGTRLMKGFARQLAGTLDFSDNSPGLTATLTVPLDDCEEQPFQVSRKS